MNAADSVSGPPSPVFPKGNLGKEEETQGQQEGTISPEEEVTQAPQEQIERLNERVGELQTRIKILEGQGKQDRLVKTVVEGLARYLISLIKARADIEGCVKQSSGSEQQAVMMSTETLSQFEETLGRMYNTVFVLLQTSTQSPLRPTPALCQKAAEGLPRHLKCLDKTQEIVKDHIEAGSKSEQEVVSMPTKTLSMFKETLDKMIASIPELIQDLSLSPQSPPTGTA